ncbi:cation diffusion facilitator family transporter [Celeribacter baekdonensis]|uniref:Cation transporter n=1 Tax=Celeribacter baekdonensis TaxID=875171 RepID=A0A2R4M7X4_9RHOB|nr:cation diffusion facilitator family transporter [Celeribacter baekdonensis]AVW93159.1 cation transporter [Celeribacter baekdonensis]
MPHDHHRHAAHAHHHHHIDPDAGDARMAAAIGVNLLLTVAQIIGGVISGSMALIADAIHNLSDAVSLVIAFGARKLARRPRDGAMTFGYGRAEVVAAMINYITLMVISIYLFSEGVARFWNPPEIEGWIVIIIAGIALVIDLITAALTYSMSKNSLNIRAAFLHNLADAGTSVAVIFGGTVILIYDWRLIDPILTVAISLYILWHAFLEIRPVIRILMLGAPDGTRAGDVAAAMSEVDGVEDVHHLHLWQIDEHRSSVEAHVVLNGESHVVLTQVKTLLKERFSITHSTLEVEAPGQGCVPGSEVS